jgi:hypothetical protein
MITIKIDGLTETINKLKAENFMPDREIEKIVERAAQPLVERIKSNYLARGHKKTGALINSIEAFKRKRKGKNDPYYTYYVGPRYTGGKSLFSYGGNAAHLLEYGTAERYRANVKAGGVGKKQGLKSVYGAKLSTGKVDKPTIGVIRQSYDEYKQAGIEFMKAQITSLIVRTAKAKGLAA